jgi:hypothetical protein
MLGFIIGVIAGGIAGTIIMAACAASGRETECRECQETSIKDILGEFEPNYRMQIKDLDGNPLELRPGKDKIRVRDGKWYLERPKEISDIIYGETIATPTDPSKPVSPENPQTLTSRMITGTEGRCED